LRPEAIETEILDLHRQSEEYVAVVEEVAEKNREPYDEKGLIIEE